MNPPIPLSATELLAAWEALKLGEPPAALRLYRPIGTRQLHRDTEKQLHTALARLANRGLTGPLTGPLRTFAHAGYHLDIQITTESTTTGLGARDGARGVLLVNLATHPEPENTLDHGARPGGFWLHTLDGAHLPTALLGLLGPIQPGRAMPVNIPEETFLAATRACPDGNPWTLADQLRARGVPATQACSVARMCGPAELSGQLGATAHLGETPRRGPWVINVIHRHTGWFLVLRRHGTITLSPTDHHTLLRHWNDLINALTPP